MLSYAFIWHQSQWIVPCSEYSTFFTILQFLFTSLRKPTSQWVYGVPSSINQDIKNDLSAANWIEYVGNLHNTGTRMARITFALRNRWVNHRAFKVTWPPILLLLFLYSLVSVEWIWITNKVRNRWWFRIFTQQYVTEKKTKYYNTLTYE